VKSLLFNILTDLFLDLKRRAVQAQHYFSQTVNALGFDCTLTPPSPVALCMQIAVATQQLWMLTELQHDGIRAIKGPMHYYGSDPYDTFRVTHALQQLGFTELAGRILDRQVNRLCRNGMWQMWETDPPADAPGLYVAIVCLLHSIRPIMKPLRVLLACASRWGFAPLCDTPAL
jgi:hypothetical protein